jgi:hypothetical protein
MSLRLHRSLSLPLLFALFSIPAFSQIDLDESAHASGALCGSEIMGKLDRKVLLANTARTNPALYQRMTADRKQGAPSTQSLSASETWDFYVSNRVTQVFDQVSAVKVWEGRTARLWVDQLDMDDATVLAKIQATIPLLGRSLDTLTPASSRNAAQGIIANDEDVYGPEPSKFAADWDNKTNFLLTDIKDGFTGSGGYIAGYFSPYDQGEDFGSNMMNLLYIDSHEGLSGGTTALSGTIAHEFQHLIHYGINPTSEVFFNEGCSEVASILNGYRDRNSSLFLNNTNVSLMRWSYNDNTLVLSDYARAMTLLHYLYEQYGESILTKMVATRTTGINRITQTLAAIGNSDTWQDVLKGFAVANYLQTYAADTRYGYKLRLSSSTAKASRTFTGGVFPSDTSMSVQAYASSYLLFSKPKGSVKLRFASRTNKKFAVMAMLTRNGSTNVTELQLDTDYTFGDDGVYDKIVVAFVSLEPAAQSVSMTTGFTPSQVSGVDGTVSGASSLALLGNAPNPFAGSTSIRFSTLPGPVTLTLFGNDGSTIRTLIDGERYEAGEHTIPFSADGLPSGYYMLRLAQGTQLVTRPIVVAK